MRLRACCALIFIALYSASVRAETVCIDPALLTRSAVSITRYFDDAERSARSDIVATRATAWFQSPTTVVTAAHVASGMKLSTQEWKPVKIEDDTGGRSMSVRIQRVVGSHTEKLAVLELEAPVPNARIATIRMAPLVPDDHVVTVAYPDNHLQVVAGRFVQFSDSGRLAGSALLEVYDGDNRLVIDYGASGAPVFDCEGRVAAVISIVMTQTLSTPFALCAFRLHGDRRTWCRCRSSS
jgi:Trypsin-like peptidase domain